MLDETKHKEANALSPIAPATSYLNQGFDSKLQEGENLVSLPEDSLLRASRKLIKVNKGEEKPDARDSLIHKRILSTGRLIKERIKIDANATSRKILRKVAKKKSLKYLSPNFLKPYVEGHIVSNPLSAPGEETNPIQIVEQMYRITQMGPGGIGSEAALTPNMQNVHPSIFGFIDPIAGPESSRAGIDVRATHTTRLGSDGKIYQKFLNKKTNTYEWLNPADLRNKTIGFNP